MISLVKDMDDMPDVVVRRISLAEFHCADEVFTTGTMGELTPVTEIDGRKVGGSKCRRVDGASRWPVTERIQAAYRALTENLGVPIP